VNLSARDLVEARLLPEIRAMLSDCGLSSNALCLEITEQHLLNDRDAVLQTLHSLKSLGVMLSVDDYGTGYSGLARLRDLPVHEIKIDRSFVGAMMTDNANAAIVRSTCELARELGLSIVAEGVEDPAALPTLIGLGCDIAQGFLLARPMDVEALRTWLATTQAEARNPSSSAFAAD